MTLRTRLALFFVAIVIPPLLAATIAFQVLSARQVDVRADSRLRDGGAAVVALWEQELRLVREQVSLAAQRLAPHLDDPALPERVATIRVEAGLDALLVASQDGTVAAADLGTAEPGPGVEPPSAEALAADHDPPGLLGSRIEVVIGDDRLAVVGGRYADAELIRDLERATSVEVSLVIDDGPPDDDPGDRRTLRVPVTGGMALVLSVAVGPGMPSWVWLVALAGLVVTVVLGLVLASVMARPMERLAEGARAVAAGRLDTRVESGDRGDVANVADVFNTMTESLRAYIEELRTSRDELRQGLERMGTTLQSTLDLEGMLEVVLDTSAVTLGARSGALFLLRGGDLRLEVARGYEPPYSDRNLTVGDGVAGRAAATGAPVLAPSGPALAAPFEPAGAETAVAVPLVRGDRTIGVIALYGRATPEPFAEEDAQTLSSFAAQASVAIENVLLHQETRQLSITDGLTGVWNRRYLDLTLRKEIERAQRFGRPLSVLMLDIDRFKRVNDRLGHQRGDEVLVEVTRRMIDQLRASIDVVGRYGGEEFVVLLPETPAAGALVVAEKIRTAIRDEPMQGAGDVSITVSVGVSTYPEDGSHSDQLIRSADDAMYRAKAAGRDRVEPRSP
jgi:diguanylate cyclase (GGDEF)-like protein